MGLAQLVKQSHLNEGQKEIVDIIGIDAYRALMEYYGGSQIWIPKPSSLVPGAEIAAEIRTRRQRGDSPLQIARELELPLAEVKKVR